MEITNMPDEIKKAGDILAEINDLLSKITQWADGEAEATVKEPYGNWEYLISETETARSNKFVDECTELLEKCDSFRKEVAEKCKSFAEGTKDKISLINKLAGDNEETKFILESVLKIWTNVEQPRLVFLYEKLTALESRIINMIKLGMQPIEAITETL